MTTEDGRAAAVKSAAPKRKLTEGVIHILSTYNNTIISVSDTSGDVILSASAGSLGFSGAKKGTPYAATKVAEFLGEKAKVAGIKTLNALVNGVGAGRDAALRSFVAQGFDVYSIRDITPIPHNGPRPSKSRRV
ncbi:30S ribosomal protein S11 [Candidatus Giovannonibacteria bacterium RIFCSPLOWO2_01_FULL_44_40]|uniref:Small ribosomal subunit protein uS11 n=1 Tax=Candidatus Giovannonibacteria bacterium RIFCSPHIGHO2_01_FULL_45_23 TaxID=1798325 RepID=A0A1F5VIM9_9BACT|nr:MAG: 30S ribosomal protein S11 [Candidatus Giovannonibacteria bacterium RIFCSPHIGHO2_01_FULL_45_23]OGF75848.1 MAG: 30S ribosomal protein S11 [Candidatus Giovannonibacteria bacterium RIFCSPHIGHO2_02_FULL_45_13]OGF80270.1 MAG: 30S ribosomal protein S11 [Candidatus Giovannonibacteria bacterium RIFCSPLOWO2_01_FULL_44_40]